jgi:hypothetical protein
MTSTAARLAADVDRTNVIGTEYYACARRMLSSRIGADFESFEKPDESVSLGIKTVEDNICGVGRIIGVVYFWMIISPVLL